MAGMKVKATTVGAVREERLMAFVWRLGGQRAHDDLERSFYRALTELRRHRTWLRSYNEITVVPERETGDGQPARAAEQPVLT